MFISSPNPVCYAHVSLVSSVIYLVSTQTSTPLLYISLHSLQGVLQNGTAPPSILQCQLLVPTQFVLVPSYDLHLGLFEAFQLLQHLVLYDGHRLLQERLTMPIHRAAE